MQFSGSLSQSTLHLKRSQEFQPIGGVRASPLSRAETTESTARSSMTAFILINATINNKHKNDINRDRWLENFHTELNKIGLFNSILKERRIYIRYLRSRLLSLYGCWFTWVMWKPMWCRSRNQPRIAEWITRQASDDLFHSASFGRFVPSLIRCSLRNLSRVTEWICSCYGISRGLPSDLFTRSLGRHQ